MIPCKDCISFAICNSKIKDSVIVNPTTTQVALSVGFMIRDCILLGVYVADLNNKLIKHTLAEVVVKEMREVFNLK